METLRNVTFIACYLGIAISILDIMTPSDKLKKQVRLIFSLVFIVAIATPIIKGEVSFEIPTIEPIEQSEEYLAVANTFNESLASNFKKNIELALQQKLEINKINAKEISAIINIEENNCISISEVDIVLAVQDENMKDEITKIVQNEIGNITVKVNVAEENLEGIENANE